MDKNTEGLYKKAHELILAKLPQLRGETLTREQFWRLLNVNPNSERHIPFKDAVNEVLWNMAVDNKKKLIVKDGRGYRVVDDTLEPIDFKTANAGAHLDLVLPFGIHEFCFLYPKNIMIVFGSKDAGKTAIMLNIIHDNMNKHKIRYLSSEMGGNELQLRLSKKEGIELGHWNFEAYERSYNFDEVIDPNGLNLVDYLELGGDDAKYYDCVAMIRRMYDKVKNGGLVVALQKNRDAQLPKGGSGALEKARIALSLDPGKATLIVAKNWVDGVTTSPKGKSWQYKLVGGINIVNPVESFGDDE